MFMQLAEDREGEAADTGTAVHKAIAAWHGGKDGLEEMRSHFAEYPLADLDEAEKQFQAYCQDPRNMLADIVLCEQPVTCEAETVYFTGTVDQVRRVGDRLKVWDVKTSKKGGVQILDEHTYQLAGYAVAAGEFLGQPVDVGGIIRTRTYRKRGVDPSTSPTEVFYESAITAKQARRLLVDAARVALEIRARKLHIGPGEHCSYCPAQGIGACLPQLEAFECQQV